MFGGASQQQDEDRRRRQKEEERRRRQEEQRRQQAPPNVQPPARPLLLHGRRRGEPLRLPGQRFVKGDSVVYKDGWIAEVVAYPLPPDVVWLSPLPGSRFPFPFSFPTTLSPPHLHGTAKSPRRSSIPSHHVCFDLPL